MNETLKVALIFFGCFLLCIVLVTIFVFAPIDNHYKLKMCRYGELIGLEAIYEDNLIWDKCFIIEDGEELTLKQYGKKHKFDGLNVKGGTGE